MNVLLLMTRSYPSVLRARRSSAYIGRLVTPRHTGSLRAMADAGMPWAADNDAFNGFEAVAYLKMVTQIAGLPGCLFVTVPDAVADAAETTRLFQRWEGVIHDCDLPVAYVAQDGIEDVDVPWGSFEALFIGGSTEFKLGAVAHRYADEARTRGKWLHMGRVNTTSRIEYAASIGCDSVDGTKWTRWMDTYATERTNAFQGQRQGRLDYAPMVQT